MVNMKFVRIITGELRFRGSKGNLFDSFLQMGVVACRWIELRRILVEYVRPISAIVGVYLTGGFRSRGFW